MLIKKYLIIETLANQINFFLFMFIQAHVAKVQAHAIKRLKPLTVVSLIGVLQLTQRGHLQQQQQLACPNPPGTSVEAD